MTPFYRSAPLRWLAFLFAIFIVLVILLADLGWIGRVFGWLYNYPNGDKVGHFVLMGILALLASLGFPTARVRLRFINFLKSSLIIAVLAMLEEFSQMFFPNRTASLLDLAASLTGVLMLGELGAMIKQKAVRVQKGV
jgi:hypothetical protein